MVQVASYDAPVREPALSITLEEQAEIATHVGRSGQVTFFNVLDGTIEGREQLPLDGELLAFDQIDVNRGVFGLLQADGGLLIAKDQHRIHFSDSGRYIKSGLSYPYGEAPIPTGLTDVEMTWIEGRLEQAGKVVQHRAGGGHGREVGRPLASCGEAATLLGLPG